MFYRCYFLFKCPLGDKLSKRLRVYETDLHQILRTVHILLWVVMINLNFFRDRLRDVAMVTVFWRESAKLAYPPSFCALAFHNGREDRNADSRVNTAGDPSTSDEKLVNFVPVTQEFCRRVCTRRVTHWAFLVVHEICFGCIGRAWLTV